MKQGKIPINSIGAGGVVIYNNNKYKKLKEKNYNFNNIDFFIFHLAIMILKTTLLKLKKNSKILISIQEDPIC